MQVIEMRTPGGPEVLVPAERPDPVPGPGEVVVDIAACSVNAADWKVRTGTSVQGPKMPHVLGRDFAGVVSAAGPGARWAVGEAVFGVTPQSDEGAYAEKIAISGDYVSRIPDGLGPVEAAAMALAGLTAMVALEDTLDLQAGERILIQGGAGGVGSMAVQIARHLGATVGATARSENRDYVEGLGATRVIDYRTEDVATAFGACDAVFDCVGGATVATTFAALRSGGRAAFIGTGRAAPEPTRPDVTALKPDVTRSRDRIDRLAALIREAGLRPPQIERMPLARAADAHAASEAGHVRGKIVLIPG